MSTTAARLTERAMLFGDARTLAGVVTLPADAQPPAAAAFVFLNAGVVHRVGPNRIYVTAARRLAQLGHLSVRFDLSGLGDSGSRRDNTPFDQASVEEARQVMSALQRDYGVSRFVTVGLCSGAVVAFRAALADERVLGTVLLNPQGFVQSEEWKQHVVDRALARTYWRDKLLSLRSWRQALTGRTQYRKLATVMMHAGASLFRRNEAVTKIARGLAADFGQLQGRGLRILLACSEGDFGVEYLNAILGPGFGRRKDMESVMLPRGDHSLTMAVSQQAFFQGLDRWSRTLGSAAPQIAQRAAQPVVAAARGRLS